MHDAVVSYPVLTGESAARVRARVDEMAAELVALSHAIAADPELAYEEHRSAARCADLLEARASRSSGRPTDCRPRSPRGRAHGPHVVICAEYDALPGVGHACGHNVIAASAVGAGLALAPLAEEVGLRVTVLGTPAEEVGGGKVDLIRAGALEGVDAAMMVHPSPYDDHAPAGLAIEEWRVVYTGGRRTRAAAPELGLNALDGVVAGLHRDRPCCASTSRR